MDSILSNMKCFEKVHIKRHPKYKQVKNGTYYPNIFYIRPLNSAIYTQVAKIFNYNDKKNRQQKTSRATKTERRVGKQQTA